MEKYTVSATTSTRVEMRGDAIRAGSSLQTFAMMGRVPPRALARIMVRTRAAQVMAATRFSPGYIMIILK